MTAAQIRDGSLRNWLDERGKHPEVSEWCAEFTIVILTLFQSFLVCFC